MALSTIELFAGVGMLGEGVRAGLKHMGIAHRTVLFVEREAYAASVLVARMEEGSLDAAPIWPDVTTFDASAWRGKVDCVIAGFPCQDLSIAGRRAGLDGKRSGLFFEAVRIATDSGARFMFLENVAGIATATASVVDEAEGELEERAAARVVGELADLGWDSEWITISASDVGASHGRARWFCLAWRMGSMGYAGHNAGNAEQWEQSKGATRRIGESSTHRIDMDNANGIGAQWSGRAQSSIGAGCQELANAAWDERNRQNRKNWFRRRVREAGNPVDDTKCTERRQECISGFGGNKGNNRRWPEAYCGVGIASEALAYAESHDRRSELQPGESTEYRWAGFTGNGESLADASGTRSQRHKQQAAHDTDGRTDGRTDARTMPINYQTL